MQLPLSCHPVTFRSRYLCPGTRYPSILLPMKSSSRSSLLLLNVYLITIWQYQQFYTSQTLHDSTQTRSRSLPHAADTKLPAPSYFRCSSLSAGVFQWSAYESVNACDVIYSFIHCQIVIHLFIFQSVVAQVTLWAKLVCAVGNIPASI